MFQTLAGPTRRGHSTTVITPWGRETYQVWLDPTARGWVARIVTLPNRMWAHPGAREAVKFPAPTAEEAEKAAIRFIEEECINTRRRIAPLVETREKPPPPLELKKDGPAPRLPFRHLVRFGPLTADRPGVTANLSRTGLFIITARPAPVGSSVLIDLRLPQGAVMMGGRVVWSRLVRRSDLTLGFGAKLFEPPPGYLKTIDLRH